MKTFLGLFWSLLSVCLVLGALWLLGLHDVVHASVAAGHLLDWIMGGLCLFWLVVILKVPWDLYFEAQSVTWELQRARERGVAVADGREEYVLRLRRRLGWAAVGAHLLSAALVAGVTYFSGGAVGYYFAGFYLVSTLFRPALAGYVYLSTKLRAIGQESRYPREDVVEIRSRLEEMENTLKSMTLRLDQRDEEIAQDRHARNAETQELRQSVHSLGRQFETAIGQLTDNQEVIKGIQAFVRLISQSARN